MSHVLPQGDAAPASWPGGAPTRYGYLVARDGPPEPRGLIADIVLDGAGLYLAASTPLLAIHARLAHALVPDLPVVPMGVELTHGPIDATLWEALVACARAAMPHEVLLAVIARAPRQGELFIATAGPYTLVEPLLDETGTGDWQPQQASSCSVRATPIPDALLEVHSHHSLPAYFSPTDDRDETARRVYGVLGRLNAPTPELAFRVPSGCKPHALEPVPFEQVFAGERGAFRDVHFSTDAPPEAPADQGSSIPWSGEWPRHRRRLLSHLLLDMADDLAAVRELLEARPSTAPQASPFWTP